PPPVPPNWFCFSAGFDVANRFLACSASSRLNSHSVPCHWLVPALVTTLTTDPALRPYSAPKECVRILNSWIASGGGRTIKPVLNESLFGAPSSRKLFDWLRMPLTLKLPVGLPMPPPA